MENIDSLISKIKSIFDYVVTDLDRACRFIGERIQQLPEDSNERQMWMEQFDRAIEVIATDDKSSDSKFLKVYLFPTHKPIIQFFSNLHRKDSDELLHRFENNVSDNIEVEFDE